LLSLLCVPGWPDAAITVYTSSKRYANLHSKTLDSVACMELML
jgi:hypothetical protein